MLEWICSEEEEREAERYAAGSALAALAAAPGVDGLQLASAWLGDVLVHLSRNVQAYNSVRVVIASLNHKRQSSYLCPLSFSAQLVFVAAIPKQVQY